MCFLDFGVDFETLKMDVIQCISDQSDKKVLTVGEIEAVLPTEVAKTC